LSALDTARFIPRDLRTLGRRLFGLFGRTSCFFRARFVLEIGLALTLCKRASLIRHGSRVVVEPERLAYLGHVGEDLRRMFGRFHLRVSLHDFAIRSDQVGDPPRVVAVGIVVRAVDLAVLLVEAEQLVWVLELGGECLVGGDIVEARTEHDDILGGEVVDSITESIAFERSTGRVGRWIEPEEYILAGEVGQLDVRSVVRGRLEVGSEITNRKHGGSLHEPRVGEQMNVYSPA